MPWVTFTAADIRDGLAVREIAIYEETAGKDFDGQIKEGSEQRIDRIASRTVEQFRGVMLSNPRISELGPAGTLPAFCIPWAIAVARVAMLGLNPVEEGRTDPRRDEYTDAVKGRDSLRTMDPAAFALTEPTFSGCSSASYGGAPLLDF